MKIRSDYLTSASLSGAWRGPRTLFISCVATLPALSCVPDFDDNTSEVAAVRVLAVRAEPAEPAPGTPVRLLALIAGPESNEAQAETLSWELCSERRAPTEAGPVAQSCVTDFGGTSPSLTPLGDGADVEFSLPVDACRLFGPLSPPIAEGETVAGRPALPDQTGGYYQPVILGWTNQETPEPSLSAVRLLCGGANVAQEELVEFNRGYRPNENPEIAGITAQLIPDEDGEGAGGEGPGDEVSLNDDIQAGATLELRVEWAECPAVSSCGDGLCTAGENATDCASDCRTEPVVGCSGAEQYLFADPESGQVVEQSEHIEVSWFSTQGTFKLSTTDNNELITESTNRWVAPSEAGEVRMWLVVRDSRRGTAWQELVLNVSE